MFGSMLLKAQEQLLTQVVMFIVTLLLYQISHTVLIQQAILMT